jgi:hypothetical protein
VAADVALARVRRSLPPSRVDLSGHLFSLKRDVVVRSVCSPRAPIRSRASTMHTGRTRTAPLQPFYALDAGIRFEADRNKRPQIATLPRQRKKSCAESAAKRTPPMCAGVSPIVPPNPQPSRASK